MRPSLRLVPPEPDALTAPRRRVQPLTHMGLAVVFGLAAGAAAVGIAWVLAEVLR